MHPRRSSIRVVLDYLERVFKKVSREIGRSVTPKPNQQAICTGCFEKVPNSKLIASPCGHKYCPPCIRQIASTALDNPDMFPARCCHKEIPLKAVVTGMDDQNKKRYVAQWKEHHVPPLERLYCPRKTCGRWIPPRSSGSRLGYLVCPHCRTKICSSCRDFFHIGWSCSYDSETKTIMELAKENNWQRCSSCLYVVEKVDGCNHMVCRCGNQFCYLCGQRERCRCYSRGAGDELATDEELDVDTLVAALDDVEVAGEPSWWAEDEA
ncbi:hypothetical protein N7475_002906 [Penicillium sp. IBT 31633x]|nr:hypothetical protein N7475_002906 [Penicillium sp. IBT 31633x]